MPFSQAMKLIWPKALPLTTTWFPPTSTASAISGLETEKRSIGVSKVISFDWPTSTLTGMTSLFSAKRSVGALVLRVERQGKKQNRRENDEEANGITRHDDLAPY